MKRRAVAEIEVSDFLLDSSIAHRSTAPGTFHSRKSIQVTTVDKLVEDLRLARVDFIKIDVEGVEELVLRGAMVTLERYRPKLSISSYHIDFNNEPQHDKLVKILLGKGYQIRTKRKYHIYAW